MNIEEKKIDKQLFYGKLQLFPFSLDAIHWKVTQKIENLQKRALRILCNDYEISYDGLLSKSSTSLIIVKRLSALCVELYKTINKVKPSVMRGLFRPVHEKKNKKENEYDNPWV